MANIGEDAIDKFQENGALHISGFVHHEWIQKIRSGIQKNLENPSKYSERLALAEGQGAYFNDYCNWQNIPEFRDFVFNSGIGELAAQLMRSRYAVFYHEHVLNKEPGTEKGTPWHHDQSYYPIDGWNMLSIWIPVDRVDKENTLRFVRGSHKWGWFHPRKFASEANYPLDSRLDPPEASRQPEMEFQDVPVEEIETGKHEILDWACDPGDIVVFHGKTLHGAGGNTSTSSHRRVLSTRWVGEGTVAASRPWQISPPILGGLKPGDVFHADIFPLVYGKI